MITENMITAFYGSASILGLFFGVLQLTGWYGTVLAVPVGIVRWGLLDKNPGPLGIRGGLAFSLVPVALLLGMSLVEMFPYALTGAWVVAVFGWRIEVQTPEIALDDPSFAGPAG